MEIRNTGNIKRVHIHPGEYYVSREHVVISTLLGSCIAACIYDPVMGVVGMNHFLLSSKRYAKEMPVTLSEAGRYGIHAMELVINAMTKLGAKRANLRVKAFGGSSLLTFPRRNDNFLCVGEVNCRFIVEFLRNDCIPLIASDLGGDRGRVIQFSSSDFSVLMRKIAKSGARPVIEEEEQFWRKSLELQKKKPPEPDLWK